MLSFLPESARDKLPAVVLCGVDAAARTALVERMYEKGGERWAVISNEAEGPELACAATERVAGQMVPHAIGCLCCITTSGLVSSLRRLYARRAQGEIDFDQVLIETLADADPAPIMQTLLNNALVTEYFRLDSVVTVLSGATSFDDLAQTRYGFKQLAVADRIVLDQTAQGRPDVAARLQHLNPAAGLVPCDQPSLAGALIGAGLETRLLESDWRGWLSATNYASRDSLENGLHGFAIESAEPVDWEGLHGWLNAGTQTNGDVMYRVKGVMKVKDVDGPVVINGVQHVYQPPQFVPHVEIDCSRMLFITANLDRAAVEGSFHEDLPEFQRLAEAREERRMRAAPASRGAAPSKSKLMACDVSRALTPLPQSLCRSGIFHISR